MHFNVCKCAESHIFAPMLIVLNSETEPYFNLAAEEFLLREKDEDLFMLWRNDKALVVGKHQNTMAEVNIQYVLQNGIKVIRRLSGGGTVFHDPGNINFTFISNAAGDDIKIDFRRFLDPVIEVLNTFGVTAEYNGRNDLLVEGMKMSGNAEHVYHKKKRTLHHGTLLYNSRIEDLSAALKVNTLKYQDKAVKSVRSKVTNISSHMPSPPSADVFFDQFTMRMAEHLNHTEFYRLTEADRLEIQRLSEEKYTQWDWNYGYSPKYNFSQFHEGPEGETEIELSVEKGYITAVKIASDWMLPEFKSTLEKTLEGCRHFPTDIEAKLQSMNAVNLASAFF